MDTEKKTSRFRKIIIAAILLVLIGAGTIWYIFTEKFIDTVNSKADYSINALDFIREFQQNDSLSNKKYIEKIIVINGVISEIEAADTTANIKMADPATGDYIIFAFQQQHIQDTKKLKVGSMVTIKGSCSGGAYSEILGIRYISFKRAAINTK